MCVRICGWERKGKGEGKGPIDQRPVISTTRFEEDWDQTDTQSLQPPTHPTQSAPPPPPPRSAAGAFPFHREPTAAAAAAASGPGGGHYHHHHHHHVASSNSSSSGVGMTPRTRVLYAFGEVGGSEGDFVSDGFGDGARCTWSGFQILRKKQKQKTNNNNNNSNTRRTKNKPHTPNHTAHIHSPPLRISTSSTAPSTAPRTLPPLPSPLLPPPLPPSDRIRIRILLLVLVLGVGVLGVMGNWRICRGARRSGCGCSVLVVVVVVGGWTEGGVRGSYPILFSSLCIS